MSNDKEIKGIQVMCQLDKHQMDVDVVCCCCCLYVCVQLVIGTVSDRYTLYAISIRRHGKLKSDGNMLESEQQKEKE